MLNDFISSCTVIATPNNLCNVSETTARMFVQKNHLSKVKDDACFMLQGSVVSSAYTTQQEAIAYDTHVCVHLYNS